MESEVVTLEDTNRSDRRVFHCLDGIRGIAALLIILRHTSQFFGQISFQESYLAVDIFFLLSGVVICNAYENKLMTELTVVKFFFIRMIRIYPLYILGILFASLAVLIDGNFSLKNVLYHVALSLFFIPNPGKELNILFPLNGPSWSLFFEIAVNLLYACILPYLTTKSIFKIVTLSAIGMIAFIYFDSSHSLDVGWTVKSFPAGFFRMGFSFFMGVMICRFYAKGQITMKGLFGTVMPFCILVLIGVLLTSNPSEHIRPYFDFLIVVVVFPAIVWLALYLQPAGFASSVFQFVGAISYAVYAIHAPLGVLIDSSVEALFGFTVQNWAPWSGLALIVFLVVLCALLDKFYDTPLRGRLLALLSIRRAASVQGAKPPISYPF